MPSAPEIRRHADDVRVGHRPGLQLIAERIGADRRTETAFPGGLCARRPAASAAASGQSFEIFAAIAWGLLFRLIRFAEPVAQVGDGVLAVGRDRELQQVALCTARSAPGWRSSSRRVLISLGVPSARCPCQMSSRPGDLRRVSNTLAGPPLRGPLFITATVGWIAQMNCGELERSSP